ncbi:MAG: PASTA domain-containing protein, partial [Haloferacaceae archaeon]
MTGVEGLIRERYPSVEVEKLNRAEQYELAGAVRNQHRLVESIQHRLVDVEFERDVLSAKLDRFEERHRRTEAERDRLRERLEELSTDVPTVEPERAVAAFASSIGDFGELERAGYAVSNLEVDLKASVVQGEEGMALHLPRLHEDYSGESLSTIRFGVRPTAPTEQLELVRIPRVVGRTSEAAERALAAADLVVGRVETEPGEPDGVVLEQFPGSGDLAEPGGEIDLVVAEESTVTVPSCLGLRLPTAKKALSAAGLSIGTVERAVVDAPNGTVIEQEPAPTEPVPRDTEVKLVVSTPDSPDGEKEARREEEQEEARREEEQEDARR